jgi:uncharacterized delta-60 repeat protein
MRCPSARAAVLALALLAVPVAALARPGELDPTWSGDGIAITDVGSVSDSPTATALQPDGKVVVVGGFAGQYLARYASDGSLDPTFGNGGIVVTNPPRTCSAPFAHAVAIDAAGRIVVAGTFDCEEWLVTRYDAAGALDPTFGAGGLAVIPVAADRSVGGMVIQPDGRIVVVGYRRPESQPNILLVRLEDDGAPDPTFGVGGFVDTIITADDEAVGVLQQPDGKLVVLAYLDGNSGLLRYDAAGNLDPTFGTGGFLTLPAVELVSIALQPDGRILAAGRTYAPPTSAGIVRFEDDGDLDTTFAGSGILLTSFGGDVTDGGKRVDVQPDGKIVLLGRSDRPGFIYDIVLARFFSDGTVDPTFGQVGQVRTLVGGSFLVADGGLLLQPDGKLLVVGAAGPFGSLDFAVYRYLGGTCGDGVLDGGEGCDFGAPHPTCCSGLCEAVSAGTPCDEDFALCHTDDVCDGAGACSHVEAPMGGCKQAVVAASGRLAAKASPPTLTWKWTRGAATSFAEFADPLTNDAYALCAYAGPSATPVVGAVAPAGGICGGRPCWGVRGAAGFRYRDRLRGGDGIEKIVLTAGGPGAAKAVVKAKGAHLTLPTLPFDLPLRVQLQSDNGGCWEGTFSSTGASINDGTRFIGRSD